MAEKKVDWCFRWFRSSLSKIDHILYICLILLNYLNCFNGNKLDAILEFTNHEKIEPIVYNNYGKMINNHSLKYYHHCSQAKLLMIKSFNYNLYVKLWQNENLIPDHYFEKMAKNGSSIINTFSNVKTLSNHCHFYGELVNITNSWAALSITNSFINGLIADNNETYYIHYDNQLGHLLFKSSEYKNSHNFKCGFSNLNSYKTNFWPKRVTRSVSNTASNTVSDTISFKKRYVELILVNDHKEFLDNNRDYNIVFERSKQIANIVNALYNQLNIFVTLVGVIIWSEEDEIQLSSNGDDTLTNFLNYRKEKLIINHPNDNSQLITGKSFDNGVVGKALKGTMCTYEYSGGVNTDHSHVIGLVATTVAHELGHNFGMDHDNESCKCPDEKCIMASASSSTSPKKWSSCSIEYLQDALSHGMDYCLKDKPRPSIDSVCGNGLLEKGEECDCGLKDFCDNKCCNASTCKLVKGAECAVGECCDIKDCSIIKAQKNFICRKASSECDVAEYCNGESEFCPQDVYVQDGTECHQNEAYCYQGSCFTYSDQCKLLWGSTGIVSDVICFGQNKNGNVNGNCGYNKINKTYKACDKADVLCGMLHCTHQNNILEFGLGLAAFLPNSSIILKGKVYTCRSAIVDLGLETRDPGLVPNGAKCDLDKMCVDQKCVPVSFIKSKNIVCHKNCSGNGLCDNKGRCHCFNGFAPPNCEYSSSREYYFTLALYIIFLFILPLIAILALIIYYFHDHIKTSWIIKARKASIKSRAKKMQSHKHPHLPENVNLRSLHISSPLPLGDEEIDNSNSELRELQIEKSCINEHNAVPIISSLMLENRIEIKNDKPLQPSRPAPPPPLQNVPIAAKAILIPPPPALPPPPPLPSSSSSSSSYKPNKSKKSRCLSSKPLSSLSPLPPHPSLCSSTPSSH